MNTTTSVHDRWTTCEPLVNKARVIQRTRNTSVQGVCSERVPVGATHLVYAGKHHLHPQSTALITVITLRTFARCNHQRNTVRTQP